jgi:hypothetical protein
MEKPGFFSDTALGSVELEGGVLYNSCMSTLNKDIVLQTLRGYSEANEIASRERAATLARMTRREGWAVFNALYDAWKQTGQQAGGAWEALAERWLAEAIALRQAFETIARRKGL